MSGRFQPYPNYQDSGTCYLREVPSKWEIKQLKRSVEGCVNGVWGQEPTGDSDDIVVIRVADFDRPRLGVSDVNFTRRAIPEKDRVRRRLRRGDLLLEKSGGGENQQVGQVVLFDADIEAVTSNFVARLRPLDGIDGRYLNYAFSSLYRDRMNTCSIKQNTGIQNLDSNAYLAEQWAFPSAEEQKQIAAFLDYETAKIDALIEKQQQLIALLGEKRQAVISHAVTKGLNPDAPMRDSGIEWLGEVPEHWTITRIKYLASRIVDGPHFSPKYTDEGYMFISARNIKVNGWSLGDAKYVSERDFLEFNKRVRPAIGDVLLTKGGTTGVARAVDLDFPFQVWVHVAVLKTIQSLANPFYLAYALNGTACYEQSQIYTRGATNNDLGLTRIANIVLGLPSLEEQKHIVEELDARCKQLDGLIAKAETSGELLQERRTALISAAVTGKIDVRGWKPPSSARMPETEMEVA